MCYWFKIECGRYIIYGLLLGSAWLAKHCESLLPIVEKNLLKQDDFNITICHVTNYITLNDHIVMVNWREPLLLKRIKVKL